MVSARRRSGVPRDRLWDSLFSSGLLAVEQAGASGAQNARDQCVLSLGDRSFDGVVEMSEAPFRFAARFPSLSDALLFIELEGAAPNGFHVGFWLSTYGVDEATAAELQRSLDAVVARLVEPGVAATL